MSRSAAATRNSSLRNLPSVDALLQSDESDSGDAHTARLARAAIDQIRAEVIAGITAPNRDELLAKCKALMDHLRQAEVVSGTRRVINATGVIIHTNLGRAPLSDAARSAIAEQASRYCTLEYDLLTGKRGRRGRRAEELIVQLTGAEDALIVNNCAAAAFFVLTAFAAGGEVVISRGEMVEIGGDFRVPDVLAQSGGILREVGTTNRTKLADYEKAINKKTRVILRVHPSNYRIVGFTATPKLTDLAALARKHKVLLYEDIGSGALIDLSAAGLADEPVVSQSLKDGVDIVTFSGDKLLGGPQAGIIAGRADLVEKLRKHPLYRALRVDKLAYAGLEVTLEAYEKDRALSEIPVLKMLSLSREEIDARAKDLARKFRERAGTKSALKLTMAKGISAVGGGAAPAVSPETTLIAVAHKELSSGQLEERLRHADPPVITRIADDKVLLDLRTVSDGETDELIDVLASL